jgi:hypothetical protein
VHANAAPQPPQLSMSVCSSTQAPLQAVNPALHWNVHTLATQAGAALATAVVQPLPHVPQLLAFVVVSTQMGPHSVGEAAAQPEAHAPATHTGVPPLHTWPQLPQLLLSVCSFTQAPLHVLFSQTHTPPWPQLGVGWSHATAVPQCPAGLHVWTALPVHCVAPGTHSVQAPW